MNNDLERRRFLTGMAVSVAAIGDGAMLWAAQGGERIIAFADTKPFNPEKPLMPWDQLTSWITPGEHLFSVAHYGYPEVDASAWKLEVGGLVDRPRTFTAEDLKARPKREHTAALECSGNGPAGGLVGNVRWAGTPLAPLLKECGLKPDGIEVVFFAADQGVEKIRGAEYKQNFARSLSVPDALKNNILLAYEMNGQPLSKRNGSPMRLVVPGWYGVAWVKWLTRIEVHDRKFLSRFMGRDYVTIRGEKRGEDTIWRETSVGRMNLKSVPARVIRRAEGSTSIAGAAWSDGTPIRSVEVKIDDGGWRLAKLSENRNVHAWTFWTIDWPQPSPGEHTITSRATDARGKVQPAPDEPFITLKKTYWEANQQAVRKVVLEG
jgi:DMSO/TMAO reductase YedYZ molybdopterin-dependent catalytic subunit